MTKTYTFDKDQNKKEIEIFKRFAGIYPCGIDLNTIQNKQPPEPDIFCCLDDGTPLNFEMVEIIDQQMTKNTRLGLKGNKIFLPFYKSLPLSDINKLEAYYKNARIGISFKPNITESLIGKAFKKNLIPFLLSANPLNDGSYESIKYPVLGTNIRFIHISNFTWLNGPTFHVIAGGFYSDPIIERIKGKFCKKYNTTGKLELLAYYDFQDDGTFLLESEDVKKNIEIMIPRSQFEKVWVYSCAKNKIFFGYPEHFRG